MGNSFAGSVVFKFAYTRVKLFADAGGGAVAEVR
jgi:hypothetical protein